jgi:hypothetical protein
MQIFQAKAFSLFQSHVDALINLKSLLSKKNRKIINDWVGKETSNNNEFKN